MYFKTTFLASSACKMHAILVQLLDDRLRRALAENADEDVPVFQIGRDVHLVNRDQHIIENQIARDDRAQLAPDDLVHAEHSMFHGIWSGARCRTRRAQLATGAVRYSFCATASSW